MNNNEITYRKAFYVIDEQAPDAYPMLAIKPKIYSKENGREISWENSGRGMKFTCKSIAYVNNLAQDMIDSEHPPEEIKVTVDGGKVLTFRVLTCEVYYNKMLNVYKGKNQKYEKDEDLQRFLLNRDPDLEAYMGMFG